MVGRRLWTCCRASLVVLLPLSVLAQSPPKEIRVVTEQGPGSIPISEFSGVEMIPLRAAASFVGATVRPGSEGAVTISGNGKMARVSNGRNFVPVEGNLVLLQNPARLVSDEWFVPLDFLTKVVPSLSSRAVSYRGRERMLILGEGFPSLNVSSRRGPNYTRVEVSTDRPVPLEVEEIEGAIRIGIETQYLETSFREEELLDGVVDRITLERDEPGYVVTVHLGERFGTLKANTPRHPGDAVVLDLFRSRVPTRGETTTGEVQWDLSEQTDEALDGEDGEDSGSPDADLGEDAPNPAAEVIELPEDYHLPPGPLDLPGEPGGPARLRIITLDPGHGGSETGAEGHSGSREKDVVLAISQKFRQMLQERLGIRVILTREGDRDLSLDERAAIANSNKSDLFVSIHADASPRRNASGSSVYFLSYSSASSAQGVSPGGGDLDFILWDMAQASHLSQSSQLAEILQEELQAITGSERINRGIKQNTFRVLKGAAMPAVLVEVGFISNPDEEKLLSSSEYQEKLAEALYRGILRYKDLFESGRTSNRARRSQQ